MSKVIILLSLLYSFTALAVTDPTKPFGVFAGSGSAEKVEKLQLQSIIHGDGIHTVIINNKLLKVGDYIGEYKLIAVNDKNVILRSEEERKQLFIFSELK